MAGLNLRLPHPQGPVVHVRWEAVELALLGLPPLSWRVNECTKHSI